MLQEIDLSALIRILALAAGLGLGATFLAGVWVVGRVKKLQLPPQADLLTALRLTPFSVVLFLDLLDFSLDIFGAPVAWAALNYLGLRPLRGITVVESLIPGTQVLPTMTLVWLFARVTAGQAASG